MRLMNINKRGFYYSLLEGKFPIIDEWGNESGEKQLIYSEPIFSMANISPARGEAQIEQFGTLEEYDKVIVTEDMKCPIDEYTVLFVDKNPEVDDSGNPLNDYIVKRVAKSLNFIAYAITKVKVS